MVTICHEAAGQVLYALYLVVVVGKSPNQLELVKLQGNLGY